MPRSEKAEIGPVKEQHGKSWAGNGKKKKQKPYNSVGRKIVEELIQLKKENRCF